MLRAIPIAIPKMPAISAANRATAQAARGVGIIATGNLQTAANSSFYPSSVPTTPVAQTNLLTGHVSNPAAQLALLKQSVFQYEGTFNIDGLTNLMNQGVISPALLLAYPPTQHSLAKIVSALGGDLATLTQLSNSLHNEKYLEQAPALSAGTAPEIQTWTLAQALHKAFKSSPHAEGTLRQLDQAHQFLEHSLGNIPAAVSAARTHLLKTATSRLVSTTDSIAQNQGGSFLDLALQGYTQGILHHPDEIHVAGSALNWPALASLGLTAKGHAYHNEQGQVIVTQRRSDLAIVAPEYTHIAVALLTPQTTDNPVLPARGLQKKSSAHTPLSHVASPNDMLNTQQSAWTNFLASVSESIFNGALSKDAGQQLLLPYVTTHGDSLGFGNFSTSSALPHLPNILLAGFDSHLAIPLPTDLKTLKALQKELARQLVEKNIAGPAAVAWFLRLLETF